MTSNIGTGVFSKEQAFGFDQNTDADKTNSAFTDQKNKVLTDLKKELRPELLARLDHVVVFEPMNEKVLKNIIRLELKKLAKRLVKKNLELTYNQDVTDFLLSQSKIKQDGARLVRKNITTHIENLLATTLLDHPESKHLSLAIKDRSLVCQTKA